MKIQTIKKNYENLSIAREKIVDIDMIASKELRIRISEIIDLQDEIIARLGDMRCSKATDCRLNFMYYALNVYKSQYYLSIYKREGRDLEYWENILIEAKRETIHYLEMID